MYSNKLVDISNWQSGNNDFVPIGKRIKRVVFEPETEKLYYFKVPKDKYPWEFWTEVISYRIGQGLDFNVLKYEPAISKDIVGCLSPSMVGENEELIHGQQFLTQILPTFETKKGTDHNFQLIESFFRSNEGHEAAFEEFIHMLVFDAVIGNRDRHQQNWAMIRGIEIEIKNLKLNAKIFSQDASPLKIIWRLIRLGLSRKVNKSIGNMELEIKEHYKFSPFFDNGNCLAYNIIESKIGDMMKNETQLENYLFGNKAVSHVKWAGIPITHIDLLKNVSENYKEEVLRAIEKVSINVKNISFEDIVTNIDNGFDVIQKDYILSLQRKELICKLLEARVTRLLSSF